MGRCAGILIKCATSFWTLSSSSPPQRRAALLAQEDARKGADWRSVLTAYDDEEEHRHWTSLADAGLLRFEKRLITKWVGTKGRVLVVGCGAGRESLALGKQGFEATGLDVSLPLIHEAAARAGAYDIQYVAGDVACIPFRDRTFDGILVFSQALAHVPGRARRQGALRDMARSLRPGGVVLLALNHRTVEDYAVSYLLHRLLVSVRRTSRRASTAPGERPEGPRPSDLPRRVGEATVLMIRARIFRWRLRTRTLRYRLFGAPHSGPESPRDLHIHLRLSRVSFRPKPGSSYFHLYLRHEFLQDMAGSGLSIAEVLSWRQLNGDQLPTLLREIDFKFLYVLRSVPA